MTQPRGQQVADKIMDAANSLFYKQGYNVTGINQIIEEAGVAKGSLYQHFPSKTDLLIGYLELNHQAWFDRLKAFVEKISDPKEKLLAVFDYHTQRQEIREYGGCPFIKINHEAGSSEPRVLAETQKIKKHARDFIKELVIASGHKQILADDELAELVFLLIEGGSAGASVFKNATDLQKAKEIVRKLI